LTKSKRSVTQGVGHRGALSATPPYTILFGTIINLKDFNSLTSLVTIKTLPFANHWPQETNQRMNN